MDLIESTETLTMRCSASPKPCCVHSASRVREEVFETALMLAQYNVPPELNVEWWIPFQLRMLSLPALTSPSLYTLLISHSLLVRGFGCCWTHITEHSEECRKQEHVRHYEPSSTHSVISVSLLACASRAMLLFLYWIYIQLLLLGVLSSRTNQHRSTR